MSFQCYLFGDFLLSPGAKLSYNNFFYPSWKSRLPVFDPKARIRIFCSISDIVNISCPLQSKEMGEIWHFLSSTIWSHLNFKGHWEFARDFHDWALLTKARRRRRRDCFPWEKVENFLFFVSKTLQKKEGLWFSKYKYLLQYTITEVISQWSFYASNILALTQIKLQYTFMLVFRLFESVFISKLKEKLLKYSKFLQGIFQNVTYETMLKFAKTLCHFHQWFLAVIGE